MLNDLSGVYRFFGMILTSPVEAQSTSHTGPNLPRQVTSTIIADKLGRASGEVTNIFPGGCGLRLTKRLRRGQYFTLMVYPHDLTASDQQARLRGFLNLFNTTPVGESTTSATEIR
jgi:hypothetical protein